MGAAVTAGLDARARRSATAQTPFCGVKDASVQRADPNVTGCDRNRVGGSFLTLTAPSAYGSKCFPAGERVGFEEILLRFVVLVVA